MRYKFNNGNGAYLCDNCSKIMWTDRDVPERYKKLTPKEVSERYVLCRDCALGITLKDFYDKCIKNGCDKKSWIIVECCHLYGFDPDASGWAEKDKFVISPVITKHKGKRRITLGRFYNLCRENGVEDDDHISMFYCNIGYMRFQDWDGRKCIMID